MAKKPTNFNRPEKDKARTYAIDLIVKSQMKRIKRGWGGQPTPLIEFDERQIELLVGSGCRPW